MKEIILDYPHYSNTMEPQRLKAAEIWSVATDARQQVMAPRQLQLNLQKLVSRVRHFRINGVPVKASWDLRGGVLDDRRYPAFGVVEYDQGAPGETLVSINSELVDGRDELGRSTAAHELAHVVFDVPGWMRAARKAPPSATSRSYRKVLRGSRYSSPTDWEERRANEFMGAFLAPPGLLHKQMLGIARELGVATRSRSDGLQVLDPAESGPVRLQAVADELAQRFGLSIGFIELRLNKYQFVFDPAL